MQRGREDRMWKRSQSKYIHDSPATKRETGYLLTLPTKWRPLWMGHHPSKTTDVENTRTDLPWRTDNPLRLGRTQFLREGVLGGSLPASEKSSACSLILKKPTIKHFWSWSKKKVLHIKQSSWVPLPTKKTLESQFDFCTGLWGFSSGSDTHV